MVEFVFRNIDDVYSELASLILNTVVQWNFLIFYYNLEMNRISFCSGSLTKYMQGCEMTVGHSLLEFE